MKNKQILLSVLMAFSGRTLFAQSPESLAPAGGGPRAEVAPPFSALKAVSPYHLVLTRVEFGPLRIDAPDLLPDSVRQSPHGWLDDELMRIRHIDPSLNRMLRNAILPSPSLAFAPDTSNLEMVADPDHAAHVEGAPSMSVLARHGLGLKHGAPDQIRLSHVVIDQIGFELSWWSDQNGRAMLEPLFQIPSQKLKIATGLGLNEIDVNLPLPLRRYVVKRLREAINVERTLGEHARAMHDLKRMNLRIFVHLFSGADEQLRYPLDVYMMDSLLMTATGTHAATRFIRSCVRALSPTF